MYFCTAICSAWPWWTRARSTKCLDGKEKSAIAHAAFWDLRNLLWCFLKSNQWPKPYMVSQVSIDLILISFWSSIAYGWSFFVVPDTFPWDRVVVVADRRRLNVVCATSGHKLHSIGSWHWHRRLDSSAIFVRMLNFRPDVVISDRLLAIRRQFRVPSSKCFF